jgi:hypothetical protein
MDIINHALTWPRMNGTKSITNGIASETNIEKEDKKIDLKEQKKAAFAEVMEKLKHHKPKSDVVFFAPSESDGLNPNLRKLHSDQNHSDSHQDDLEFDYVLNSILDNKEKFTLEKNRKNILYIMRHNSELFRGPDIPRSAQTLLLISFILMRTAKTSAIREKKEFYKKLEENKYQNKIYVIVSLLKKYLIHKGHKDIADEMTDDYLLKFHISLVKEAPPDAKKKKYLKDFSDAIECNLIFLSIKSFDDDPYPVNFVTDIYKTAQYRHIKNFI